MLAAVMAILGFLFTFNVRALPSDLRREPEWHVLDVRRQPQGLPQNTVDAILQTSDGYLWVGTSGGLARFDGAHFSTFDNRNRNQLKENEIWTLAEGADSSLWIGTYGGGVTRLKKGQFTTYTTREGLVNDVVRSVCRDPQGSIWIGTDGGVSRFKDEKFTSYTLENGLANNSVWSLYCDPDGSIWIGEEGTLDRFKDEKISPVRIKGLEKNTGGGIGALLRDRHHALWAATTTGLLRLREGETTRYTTQDGLSSNRLRCLYEDPAGNLWIGAHEGLTRYRDGKFYRVNLGDLVPSVNINSLGGDREGNLWIGTFDQGLVRLHQGQFLTYDSHDGLASDHASTVLEDDKGNTWIGTTRGLSALRGGRIQTYAAKDGLPERLILSLAQDKAGNLWVGTEVGLYRSRDATPGADIAWAPQFVPVKYSGMPNLYPRVIFPDRNGDVWIGTNLNGVLRYTHQRFIAYTTTDGLSNNAVRAFAEDAGGNLWIGTRHGLNRFDGKKFDVYTEKDGLAGDSVAALYMDDQNVLWIATRQGLSRLKNGTFTTYTVNDGLYSSFAHSLVEDTKGNLWINSNRGISRVSKQQLNDFADKRIKSISTMAYGLEHGLNSTVATAGVSPAAYKGRDGRVWFATARGVSVVDPRELSLNTLAPPVHIEQVSVDQHSLDLNRAGSAPPGRGDLAFQYTGLSFLAPEHVRFKYKLEGYDRDWINAGDRRAAYYSNIPPGRYTFRVIAANNDGIWNNTGEAYTFYLRQHFYETYRFYAICAVLFLLLLWWLFRLYEQRLKRREHELAVMEDALVRRTTAEEQLRHSELRYRDLFESAVYGIYRARGGSYLEVNQAMVAMLGYDTKEEILRLDPATQVYADPADISQVIEALNNAGRVEGLEVTWKRKDGKHIIVRLSGRRIPDPQRSGDTAEIIAEDVTEHKQLEDRLRQAQKMDAIGRLAGGIAHDFNNLLTVILGYTRLVLERNLNPEIQSALHRVEAAGDRAAALTNQLLAFSRHQMVQAGIYNLNSVIESMKTILERVIGEDIEFSIDLAPDLGFVRGDRSQLEQIIMNLAANARDAMPHGGRVHFVTRNFVVEERTNNGDVKINPGTYVLLEVSDTGSGMDTKTQARIFEPFFTTKEVGRGTGLGLSTIYGIVQQSGGYIDVDSSLGRGTTFRIYLPQVLVSEILDIREHKRVQKLSGSETILLIEDDSGVRDLTSAILRTDGYNVLSAAEAAAAERICRDYEGRIDLIVTDVVMPKISGPELVRRLQKLRPGLRLIYTSGYTESHRLREEVVTHNLPFLQKPYTRSELLSKVREVLDASVSQAAL
jgi:PAS domain S-box-containing protein